MLAGRTQTHTINLGRIVALKYAENPEKQAYSEAWDADRDTIVLELTDERNALERVSMHFANLKKNAVKIKFYDFAAMGYGQNVYAASTYDSFGNRVIYVNTLYKDAPVEQIACLIAHESCHILRKSNMQEETVATQKEAACWTKYRNSSTTYPQNKLTKRLDKLANMYLTSTSYNNKISQ